MSFWLGDQNFLVQNTKHHTISDVLIPFVFLQPNKIVLSDLKGSLWTTWNIITKLLKNLGHCQLRQKKLTTIIQEWFPKWRQLGEELELLEARGGPWVQSPHEIRPGRGLQPDVCLAGEESRLDEPRGCLATAPAASVLKPPPASTHALIAQPITTCGKLCTRTN